MSRSERLFRLLQALRTLPSPVTAEQLAAETGVSVRSIYRDIESLRMSGAEIGGERGLGYCLVEDGSLPPQTFTRLEIEALVLGLAQVRHLGDPALARAAASVLGKVVATLPSAGQQHIQHAVSQVHRFNQRPPPAVDLQLLREACWREEALQMAYIDRDGAASDRKVWPLSIVYVDSLLVLFAWCCLRQDFRMFRLERIQHVENVGETFRPRRAALLRQYLSQLQPNATESQ
ncbi:helix-turn-helix transcriptional regulator [Roseateles sp. NT4]|uniref:helix-turn-helix transcriptional regulator n=1 Tax=Roseateles sp. NT4 TaxID=3453715 RepID=UPI003EE8B3D8